jgi:hypothetical protein
MGAPNEPANRDKIQTEGRKDNAAQPLNSADANAGAERYPSVRQDDAVERTGRAQQVAPDESRSFGGEGANPQPRQGAGDGPNPSLKQGHMGPDGDPAEGKR